MKKLHRDGGSDLCGDVGGTRLGPHSKEGSVPRHTSLVPPPSVRLRRRPSAKGGKASVCEGWEPVSELARGTPKGRTHTSSPDETSNSGTPENGPDG